MTERAHFVTYTDRKGKVTHRLKIKSQTYLSAWKAAYANRPTKSHNVGMSSQPLMGHFSGIDMGTLTLDW